MTDYVIHTDYGQADIVSHGKYDGGKMARDTYPDVFRTREEAAQAGRRRITARLASFENPNYTNDKEEYTRIYTLAFTRGYLTEVEKLDGNETEFKGMVKVKKVERTPEEQRYTFTLSDIVYLKTSHTFRLTINKDNEVTLIEEL